MNAPDFAVAMAQAETLAVDCIGDSRGFRALRDEWILLHSRCPTATPFNSWEWLYSWWQAYAADKRLCLLTCRMDGELIGIAPLYLTSQRIAGVSIYALRMIGDATSDSDYLHFVLRPDLAEAIASRFIDWLFARGIWDVMVLRELPADSVLASRMTDIARERGFSLRTEYGRCAAVEFPDNFDAYLSARQSRFRTKVRALLRRLDAGGLSTEVDQAGRMIRRRLRSLYQLHRLRWQSAGEAGVFESAAKRRFYAHFVPKFARRGWLRFYSLRKGDAFVAHQLCFASSGTTFLLQEGFDVTHPSESFGQMLRAAVMRELIATGARRYDFLGGFSKHKEDWGAEESKIVHLVIARSQWRGQLYFKAPVWREKAVDAMRRFLPQPAIQILKHARRLFSR